VLVTAGLTGLRPGTTYYYRLDTTNTLGTLHGQQQSFTTAAAPVPALAITTKSLPAAKRGAAYTATLAAAHGVTPYQWLVTGGHLPTGLHLAQATGVISGRLGSHARAATFIITVIDASSPVCQAVSATFTIKVN
jgi:Putative Ig domain